MNPKHFLETSIHFSDINNGLPGIVIVSSFQIFLLSKCSAVTIGRIENNGRIVECNKNIS